jgi:hypothetical protein
MAKPKQPRNKVPHNQITPELLRSLFSYNKNTGLLTRIKNGRRAGFIASNGYFYVSVGNRWLLVHRVIWAIETGHWPKNKIDHKNRIRSDNTWGNIREASDIENGRNISVGNRNTSGFKGVSFHRASKKWRAQIVAAGTFYSLGLHKTREQASNAYKEAAKKLHTDFASF